MELIKKSAQTNLLQILSHEFLQNEFLQPLIGQIYQFYVHTYLCKWLRSGELDEHVWFIRLQPETNEYTYLQGVLDVFDPIGRELVTIGRNQKLFLNEYGKIIDFGKSRSSACRFFTDPHPEEIIGRKFEIDQIQGFYQFIQQACVYSQQLVLQVF